MIDVIVGGDGSYLEQVVNLDHKVFSPWAWKTEAQYREIFDKSPNSFLFSIDSDTGKLIGYLIVLPVTKEYFERTLLPDFSENDISPDKIKNFSKGTNNLIYLMGIANDPHSKDRLRSLNKLSVTYKNILKSMAQDEFILVSQASALACGEGGVKLCLGLKMNEVCTNHKGVIYVNRKFHEEFLNLCDKQELLKALQSNVIASKRIDN
jgi:hypothetical protein